MIITTDNGTTIDGGRTMRERMRDAVPDWPPSNIKIGYDTNDRAVIEVRYDVSHALADEIRKRITE